ncbi:MAG: hypothetical protein LBR83_09895 [Clostridiales bacterium]|nr:hypothetical protein [Clostridiales bacterium]
MLIFIFAVSFFFPATAEISRAREAIRLQEELLRIRRYELAELNANKSELELRASAGQNGGLPPYNELAVALASVTNFAREMGLTERLFSTGEPVALGSGDGIQTAQPVIAITSEAVYEGDYGALCGFIEKISAAPYGIHMDGVTLEISGEAASPSTARIVFSVYGAGA